MNNNLLLAELPHDLRAAGYKESVISEILALITAGPKLLEIATEALEVEECNSLRDSKVAYALRAALAKVRP
jgi:hypothetical protein